MPTFSLYSANWHKVSSVFPTLQPGTRIQKQILRHEEWFVFTHPVTRRHYRVNRKAYELIARFNGEHSVDSLWNGLLHREGDNVPTQDEVIVALSQFVESGLILLDRFPDDIRPGNSQIAATKDSSSIYLNPFAFKLRLFDPSAFLQRLSWLQKCFLHPISMFLFSLLIIWAFIFGSSNWDDIHTYAEIHFLTPRCLLLGWLFYPVMKSIHELGHALVIRRCGGEIRDVGIAFFLLIPSPYIDASASIAFPNKWQRIAVSSAGIIIELVLAAVALAIWSICTDGLMRDSAFVVMAIGSISTIAFNGNPLLRLDGYYILCDLLELPNLGSRSQCWWNSIIRRYFFGMQEDFMLQVKGREHAWLMLYAPIAWIYRSGISFAIVQLVANKSALAAVTIIIWMVFSLLLKPIWRFMSGLRQPAHPGVWRWQSTLLIGLIVVLLFVIFFVPLRNKTISTGIVWLPEQSQIRASSDSMVNAVLVHDGEHVAVGQALAILDAPDLQVDKKRLSAQIYQAQTEQANGWLKDRQDGENAFEKISRLRKDLIQLNDRIDHLVLRAEVDGTFVLSHPEEIIGTYLSKGTLLAYVLPNEITTVRAVISQEDIGRIRGNINAVSVLLEEDGYSNYDARVLRIEPAASNRLPSKVLGDQGGASLVTNPRDKEGLTLLEPVFFVDVRLSKRQLLHVGSRTIVCFEHDSRPLANTAIWNFKQLFLKLLSEK